jgi:antitoxin component YwqK of YwqJK toxin-antitoxin module
MKKIFTLLVAMIPGMLATAQTFQVFKGDTINRRNLAGKQEGVWRKYYKNDTLASEMFYRNGRHEGVFRTFSEKGVLQSEVKFRPGYTETGDAKLFYEDGTVKAKGKYMNRLKDSTWTYYDQQGKLSSTEYFIKGKQEGIARVYYPDGKIASETIYKNDKKNGPYKEFYPDGTPKVISTNKNGEYEGIAVTMYQNGKVWEQGKFVNGLRDGKWIVNKPDGTLDHEENYKNGKILNPVAEKEEKLDEGVIKGPDER